MPKAEKGEGRGDVWTWVAVEPWRRQFDNCKPVNYSLSMPALENAKHEAFVCEWMKREKSMAECFLATAADPAKKLSQSAANSAAIRILARPEVQERVEELRLAIQNAPAANGEEDLVLSIIEKRKYLARVVRVDYNEVDITKHGDLIQTIRQTQYGPQIVLHDKIAAIKLDNEMTGGGGGYDEIQFIIRRTIRPGSPIDRAGGKTLVDGANTW